MECSTYCIYAYAFSMFWTGTEEKQGHSCQNENTSERAGVMIENFKTTQRTKRKIFSLLTLDFKMRLAGKYINYCKLLCILENIINKEQAKI